MRDIGSDVARHGGTVHKAVSGMVSCSCMLSTSLEHRPESEKKLRRGRPEAENALQTGVGATTMD